MKSSSFSGTIIYFHPETDEAYEVEYEGVYEPACNRGHIDNWTPDESWLEVLDLHEDLEFARDEIQQLCWDDFHNES